MIVNLENKRWTALKNFFGADIKNDVLLCVM